MRKKDNSQPEICKGCCFAGPNSINLTCRLEPIWNKEQ